MVAVSPFGATVYTKYVDPAQNTANVVPRSISAGIAWNRGKEGGMDGWMDGGRKRGDS